MLDYLRIMLDARLAKMDERGASAVEYGLLIAGIAALIVVVVFAFGGVHQEHVLRTPARALARAARRAAAERGSRHRMAADPEGPRPNRASRRVRLAGADRGQAPHPGRAHPRQAVGQDGPDGLPWVESKAGSAHGALLDIIVVGGLRPSSALNRHLTHHPVGEQEMLDYLRIMLNARLAKMDERGASAVEYGLLIAGIAALIVVVVFAFGGVIKSIFKNTCTSVAKAARDLLC